MPQTANRTPAHKRANAKPQSKQHEMAGVAGTRLTTRSPGRMLVGLGHGCAGNRALLGVHVLLVGDRVPYALKMHAMRARAWMCVQPNALRNASCSVLDMD